MQHASLPHACTGAGTIIVSCTVMISAPCILEEFGREFELLLLYWEEQKEAIFHFHYVHFTGYIQ